MKIKKFSVWLFEKIKDGIVICDKCNWKWDIVTGGKDMFTCHKCGHDNHPKIK